MAKAAAKKGIPGRLLGSIRAEAIKEGGSNDAIAARVSTAARAKGFTYEETAEKIEAAKEKLKEKESGAATAPAAAKRGPGRPAGRPRKATAAAATGNGSKAELIGTLEGLLAAHGAEEVKKAVDYLA